MAQARAIRDRLHALARAQGMHFIKIEPDLEDLPVHRQTLRTLGFQPSDTTIQPRSTIRVDLGGSEEELLARMKSKCRYNIRKSRRSGTRIRHGTLSELDTLQVLLDETGVRHGFHYHSIAYYRQALEAMPDTLCLLFADVQDEPVAAMIVAAIGNGAWYPWGASSQRHRSAMPNYGLYFAAMQWARQRNADYYDLWGIPTPLGELARSIRWQDDRCAWPHALPIDLQKLPRRDLWTVYRMKQAFGGRILHLIGAWDLPVQPAAYRLFVMGTRGLELARAARRRAQTRGALSPQPRPRSTPRLHLAEVDDPQAWNRELSLQPHTGFMQSWEWGVLKARTAGWEPMRYRILTAAHATVGQFQILYRRIHPRLPMCIAYVPRGPALDWTDTRLVAYALEAIADCARSRHCVSVRIDPNVRRDRASGMAAIAQLEEQAWRFSTRPTQFQNTGISVLPDQPDALMATFKSRCRSKVRQAQRSALTIRQGTLADLPNFYRLYADTGQRKGFAIRACAYYQALLSLCHVEGTAAPDALRSTLLLAEHPDVGLVGGVYLLALGSWAWYLLGASRLTSDEHMQDAHCGNPNHLLQWEAMQWARAQGCTQYDWWGAPLDPLNREDALYGVWRFKQDLGARFTPLLGAWDRYFLPGPTRRMVPLLHQLRDRVQDSALIRGDLPV